jgi:hypothetical protein
VNSAFKLGPYGVGVGLAFEVEVEFEFGSEFEGKGVVESSESRLVRLLSAFIAFDVRVGINRIDNRYSVSGRIISGSIGLGMAGVVVIIVMEIKRSPALWDFLGGSNFWFLADRVRKKKR